MNFESLLTERGKELGNMFPKNEDRKQMSAESIVAADDVLERED